MREERYQGWSNWETWVTMLWIGNDEYLYELFYSDSILWDSQGVRDIMEENIYEDMLEGRQNLGLLGDILSAFFQSVDWREIAESINEDD